MVTSAVGAVFSLTVKLPLSPSFTEASALTGKTRDTFGNRDFHDIVVGDEDRHRLGTTLVVHVRRGHRERDRRAGVLGVIVLGSRHRDVFAARCSSPP